MKSRAQSLELASATRFDVVIIGGGIVGAGCAQDAASRGLNCLLIEKEDFSSGTSSKTTKLIHGGLRYLEQFQFRLTRELCKERALLEQLAPHLVKDFSFIMPITHENKMFSFKARMGLTLYDVLSGQITSLRRHESLSVKETLESAPSLNGQSISGGLKFHDCISDDSRMVIEVVKSAESMGCVVVNYLEAKDFEMENGRVTKVVARDRYSGSDLHIECNSVINAAGVWSDQIASKMKSVQKNKVVPAKGTHIMVPLSSFETNSALFLPNDDGRYVFVVPWQKALMIGTTDTNYSGSIDDALPTVKEVDYLLDAVNKYAGKNKLARADVIAAWAGLRPLVGQHDRHLAKTADESKSTANLSREHFLFEGPENVVGLIGGKLTNYRILADHVMEKILAKLPAEEKLKAGPSKTHDVMLGGWENKSDYLTVSSEISTKARSLGVEPASLDHLLTSYGAGAKQILEMIEQDPLLGKRISAEFPPLLAEVIFVVKNEMAVSLEDILFRRIRLGLVHHKECQLAASKVARLVQSVLGWDDSRVEAEISAIMDTIDKHTVFESKKKEAV